MAAADVPPLPPAATAAAAAAGSAAAAAAAAAGSDAGGGGDTSGAVERVPLARKPRNREVSSRYKSALSQSRRCPSPNLGRSTDSSQGEATMFAPAAAAALPLPVHKRAISAERKRDFERDSWLQQPACASAPSTPVVDHALRPNGGRPRRATPERRKLSMSNSGTWRQDQAENARPFENLVAKPEFHKWPAIASVVKSVSKSVDLSADRDRSTTVAARPLSRQGSGRRDVKCVRRLLDEADLGRCDAFPPAADVPLGSVDTSSVSISSSSDRSESERPATAVENSQHETRVPPVPQQNPQQQQQQQQSQKPQLAGPRPNRTRGTEVPARFWQDLGTNLRRLSDVNQLRSSMTDGTDLTATARASRRSSKPAGCIGNPVVNTPANAPAAWSFSPPGRTGPQQPSSPSSKAPSPCRTLQSPTKGKLGVYQAQTPFNGFQPAVRSSSVACMLNFGVDTSKGKKALSQQEEAQYLRVLHNRWLQWRLVNARAEAAMESQKSTAEKVLYNASMQISDLRSRVIEKRIEFQQEKQREKVNSMLSSHAKYLDEWEELEPEHSSSLTGTIQALEAGSLRVPVTGGAKVDVHALKQALCSAADVVGSLESSVGRLQTEAEKTSDIVSELAQVAAQEKAVLQECGELLDIVTALETEERSLRSYFVQLENEKARPSSSL